MIIFLSGSSIAENSPLGSVVGILSTSEPDALSFALLNDAAGLFSIGANNELIVSGPLDHEQQPFQVIVVLAFSPIFGLTQETFLIAVGDVVGCSIKLSGYYDRCIGTEEEDNIVGSAADNKISGRGGDDRIFGGGGDDVLVGGYGCDELRGNRGADLFVFRTIEGSTVAAPDQIFDFRPNRGDKIDLRGLEVNSLGGAQFDFIGNAAFGSHEGELRFDASTHLLQGDVDGDGTAEFAILINVSQLARSDLLL